MTAPTQTRIAFHLPAGGAAALESHPALRDGEAGTPVRETVRETATFFDTADRALARAGASLRLCRTGGRCAQVLEQPDGLTPFGRGRWEWKVKGSRPEPQLLAETPLAGLAGELSPLFTTEATRTLRRLQRDGATLEITLDEGSLRAGDKAEPLREIGLELREGPPGALYRLADLLQADLPLLLSGGRLDRGWHLLTGQPHRPQRSGDIGLPQAILAAEGLRRMIAAALAELLSHRAAAAAGAMEGVHGMRVAARRLRALLALFRPHLAAGPEAQFTAALRQIAGILGEARDWDVFCAQTLPDAAGSEAERLRPLAEAERSAAHRRVAEELARPDLARAVLGLMAWAEEPEALSGQPGGGELAEPLLDLAPELAERLARKAWRRGRRFRHRSETELHDLRKALKRLRYGVEFLAPLFREGRLSAYLHRCKRLQERLGGINDAAVATALAGGLAQGDASLAPAADAVKAWADARRAEAHKDLRKTWRAFKDAPLPRPVG